VEAATGGTAFNLPITLGSVVPIYHLPGLASGLVFSGEVLADLYLGRITFWNDPRLQELNPDVELPHLPVIIAYRSDGSGTTAIWTDYLSKMSQEWEESVGFGTRVEWPAGLGGSGNEGVAAIVKQIPGTLGYSSLVYATLNGIPYGAVINRAGKAIVADLESTTAAGEVELPEDGRVSITDTEAEEGYPIAGFAWLLIYENLEENNAIATLVPNPFLAVFLKSLQELGEAARAIVCAVPGALEQAVMDHRRIAEALKAKDPEAACEAVSDHLENVLQIWQRATADAKTRERIGTSHPGPAI
jgi:phosphate ABC transporter phosphate-binding protein